MEIEHLVLCNEMTNNNTDEISIIAYIEDNCLHVSYICTPSGWGIHTNEFTIAKYYSFDENNTEQLILRLGGKLKNDNDNDKDTEALLLKNFCGLNAIEKLECFCKSNKIAMNNSGEKNI